MNTRNLLSILTIFLVLVTCSAPEAQAKKDNENDFEVSSDDRLKNSVGINFGIGGNYGSGGLGLSLSVGATYFPIKYISLGTSIGYGFLPTLYIKQNNDTENVFVHFLPWEVVAHVHPVQFKKWSPYFGPGGGLTYVWFEYDEVDYSTIWYNVFVDAGILLWVSKNFGVNLNLRYTIPYLEDAWHPENASFSLGISGIFVF